MKKIKSHKKSIGVAVAVVGLLYFAFSILSSQVLVLIDRWVAGFSDEGFAYMVQMLISYAVTLLPVLVIGVLLVRRSSDTKQGLANILPSSGVGFGNFISGVCFCIGFANIGNIISAFLSQIMVDVGLPEPMVDLQMPSGGIPIVLYIIAVMFLPPLLEEAVARGVTGYFTKPLGALASGIVSGLFFALIHANIAQMPSAFMFGFAAGVCLVVFDNIWIGIVAHFLNNTYALIMQYVSSNIPSTDYLTILIYLLWLLVPLCGMIVFFVKHDAAEIFHTSKSQTVGLLKTVFHPLFILFATISVSLAIITLYM